MFFKVDQSSYNLRLLHYIKNKLHVGSVYVDLDSNIASYRLRNLKDIVERIWPIFDKYPLLTKKYFSYEILRKKKILSVVKLSNYG